jgi:hypothetical protein
MHVLMVACLLHWRHQSTSGPEQEEVGSTGSLLAGVWDNCSLIEQRGHPCLSTNRSQQHIQATFAPPLCSPGTS